MTDRQPLTNKSSVIERLRRYADEEEGYLGEAMREATAEIDRLQGEYAEMQARCAAAVWLIPADKLCGELQKLRDEFKARLAPEPCEQRPADGTRDGDGVWQGGFWHPDTPDPLDEWQLMEFAPKDGARILALITEVQLYRDTATPNELIPVVVKWTGEYSGWSMPGHGGLRPTLWLPIKLTNDSQGASRDASSDDPSKVNCIICGKLWGEHSAQEQADCSAAL